MAGDGHDATVRAGVTPAIRESARLLADNYGVSERPLVFVTGKGGVGKTTVAGALALVVAERRRSALVCGSGPEVALGGGLESLCLDPERALGEWLARHLGSPAAALLQRARTFTYFVAAAPGAAELVTIGKAVDVAREGRYDSVIVDAPATGHALAMLDAPRPFAELAPAGPIAREAEEVRRRLADPAFTAYVGVTAPEDLAVAELLELERSLPGVVGRGLDLIVVNAIHADHFGDEDADDLRAAADGGPGTAVLEAVLVEHQRARREAERVRHLRECARAPVITLPYVFPPLPTRLGRPRQPSPA
jgi:hypothetical protein